MRRSDALRGLVPVLLVLAATGGIGLLPGAPVAAVGGHSDAVFGVGHAGQVRPAGPVRASASLPPGPGPNATVCAILASRYSLLYPGPALPPSIAPLMNAGCALGSDEADLGLLSNASASGERVDLALQLPDAAGGAAGGLLAYEVRMWVTGVPCSVGGAALLSVDLIPPYGGVVPSASANWSVFAPVYDLVPAGGCDPTCQNATALFSLPGIARSFCEDNAVVRGPGSGTSAIGTLVPGDSLGLTLAGSVGGTNGLTVYLNDSTHPGLDLQWGYPANHTISRQVLDPLDAVSDNASNDGWSLGPSVSVAASLCPSVPSARFGTNGSCNSYDGPHVNASSFPTLTGVHSWNATLGDYADSYPWVAPASASGACSGATGAAPCREFDSGGGTGSYPYWSLSGGVRTLGWRFGGSDPTTVADLGGPAQFAASGAASLPSTDLGISAVQNATASTGMDVRVHVSSPAGIGSVSLSVYFCTVLATSPSVTTTAAAEDAGATNTSSDGNFSATELFAHSEKGTAFYWITADTASGATLRAGPWRAAVSGGANACVDAAPPTPTFSSSNVTAIGGGYLLNFTENDPAVTNYTLWITPEAPPYVPFSRSLSSTGPVAVLFGGDGQAFNLSLTATDVAGLSSAASAAFTAPIVGTTLSLTATTLATGDLWIGADTTSVNLTATGGVAPYTYRFDLGNGSTVTATLPGIWENVSHNFGDLDGVAVVRAEVTDAVGVQATAPLLGISILAGPLGVNQSLSAGAFDVQLTWSVPASPAGPITGYTVFYTNRSAGAPTVSDLWSMNRTGSGGFLWNTTSTFLDLPNVQATQPVYAIVVAWDALGVGTLPSGWLQTPSALPLNLSYSAISVSPTGGPAPLTVSVSDTLTLGTNGTLVEGLYSFGASGSAPANFESNLSGGVAIWWLNASWTFPNTGTYVIQLHASDFFSDTVIPITSVYVGPAGAPSAVARITSGTPLVGQPVGFDAVAGGGTGVYALNWSFGDGGTGSGPTPSHVYETAGNYTAILEVTDTGDGLTTLAPVNLTVFANPSVSIEASAAGSSGLSFQFTAVETGGVGTLTYAWTFGDGATAAGPSANHTFASPGEFNVSVTVTDALRHSAVAGIVVVAPTPPATGSPGTPALTGPELAAYALLGALAVLLLIGLLYFWSKSRQPPVGPAGPDPFPTNRVRATPPPDPPDPS